MKTKLYSIITGLFIGLMLTVGAAEAQLASGGQFALSQSTIASGGSQNAAGGQFTVAATSGQAVAGQKATGIMYSQHAGFWMDEGVAVSSMVSVNGQVQTVDGAGIRNVTVTIKDGNGFSQSAVSSAFGFYSFQNVPVGGSYTLTVTSRNLKPGSQSFPVAAAREAISRATPRTLGWRSQVTPRLSQRFRISGA